jgi:hypothetical protein
MNEREKPDGQKGGNLWEKDQNSFTVQNRTGLRLL